MKDFVRDAINIPCHIETKKVRGQAVRQVSLVLDKTNKYASILWQSQGEVSRSVIASAFNTCTVSAIPFQFEALIEGSDSK